MQQLSIYQKSLMIVYLVKEAGIQENEMIIYLKLELHNPLIFVAQSQSMRTLASWLNIACFVKKRHVRS